MKIKVLGTLGEIKESSKQHQKHSGVLIDNKILLDFGDKEFLNLKPQIILITHLHPDHAYFVRHNENPNIQIPIYAPEKYQNVNIYVSKNSFKFQDYVITPVPTIHSIKVRSNAYLLEHENKRLLYTGDMIAIEKKYRNLIENLDLVITESSFLRHGGSVRRKEETGEIFGHAGIPNLISFFKRFTNKILLVHFGAWFFKDFEKSKESIEILAQDNGIEILIGHDNLELKI